MSEFQFAAQNLEMRQLNALVKKLGGEDVVRGILADRMLFEITERELLAPLDPITIRPVGLCKAQNSLKTCPGLYVYATFTDRVLPAVQGEVSLPEEITLPSYTLTERAADKRIRENLPENHVFGADELCAILIDLVIKSQPNGTEGPLLTNGYANLFYVKGKDDHVCLVVVRWSADYRGWSVLAWSLDAYTWNAEYRVFSRNC
jgi:hypothetical protein